MGLGYRFNISDRFLGHGPAKNCLDRLPNDILIDDIIGRLDVTDIVRLRMVSRLYYEVTQHAAVWKRLLPTANIPLPPLPPTARNTLKRMSGLEAERLLIRAHSRQRNWKKPCPKALREWSFEAHDRILDMTLLPGGQYIVASVADRTESIYSLVVFAMDHLGTARPVAATKTETKVFSIQAKYMTVHDKKSIAIAYLRRYYHHKTDRRLAGNGMLEDASHYSTKYPIDHTRYQPEYNQDQVKDLKFRYECVALHVPLDTLEYLADIPYPTDTAQFREEAERLPPPFRRLLQVTSRSILSSPVLAEMYGAPYLAVVKGSKDIVFKNLGAGGIAATLTCMEQPSVASYAHSIKAIRFLPAEHSIFVIREVDVRSRNNHMPAYYFEMYPALKSGPTKTSHLHLADRCTSAWQLGEMARFDIPEFPVKTRLSDVLNSSQPSSNQNRPPLPPGDPEPPLPLCVYGLKKNDEAFYRFLFHPRRNVIQHPPSPVSPGTAGGLTTRQEVTYVYTLADHSVQHWNSADYDTTLHMVPAYYSPLVYSTPWEDRTDSPLVLNIRPYIDRGWEVPGPRLVLGDVVRHPKRQNGLVDFGGHGGPRGLDMHVSAFAWDETIGRLVVARNGLSEVLVYDFAAAPRQNFKKERYPIPLEGIPDPDVPMERAESPDFLPFVPQKDRVQSPVAWFNHSSTVGSV